LESRIIRRILHSKDSQAKLAFFHNEIIDRLDNGEKITVVNMPEFESIENSRIKTRSVDEIYAIQPGQTAFIFGVYPNTALIDALGRLECKEINITVLDFSAIYVDLFAKMGFETFCINDNYLCEKPVFGSVEELNAAVLRTVK